MKKLFWDDYYEIINGWGVALIVVAFFSVLMVGSFLLERNYCMSAFEDYSPKWGVISGCRIKFQGKLTPVKMIKNINI